jgi:hypothetical protein
MSMGGAMNDIAKEPTFDDLFEIPPGTILSTINNGLMKGMVMRNMFSLCAYIGIPMWHPLANLNYDDIPLEVHGGLTFGSKGDGEKWPSKFYWYGWDYGHYGDMSIYPLELMELILKYRENEHGWTVAEVEAELQEAMEQFKKLFYIGWIPVVIRLFIHHITSRRYK